MSEMTAAEVAARRKVMQWLFGTMATQVVGVSARLNLAEAIGDEEAHVDDLARAYDIPAERLNRLLRALAALGLCEERSPGSFALNDAGSLLRRDTPRSLHYLVLLLTEPVMQEAWLNLGKSVRTGRTAFEELFGKPVFQYMAGEPELSQLFNAAMSQRTRSDGVAGSLPARYDFARFTSLTDVGGGDGTLLASVLGAHPTLKGVLFDTPQGVAEAQATLDGAGLGDRCAVVGGDFFDSVPPGSDLYMIKSVLHNWDDERCVEILRRIRAGIPSDGRLLIIEPVLPEVVSADTVRIDAAEDPYMSDLNMMVLIGGRERTRTDFESLCADSGFAVERVIDLPADVDFSLVEARPV